MIFYCGCIFMFVLCAFVHFVCVQVRFHVYLPTDVCACVSICIYLFYLSQCVSGCGYVFVVVSF